MNKDIFSIISSHLDYKTIENLNTIYEFKIFKNKHFWLNYLLNHENYHDSIFLEQKRIVPLEPILLNLEKYLKTLEVKDICMIAKYCYLYEYNFFNELLNYNKDICSKLSYIICIEGSETDFQYIRKIFYITLKYGGLDLIKYLQENFGILNDMPILEKISENSDYYPNIFIWLYENNYREFLVLDQDCVIEFDLDLQLFLFRNNEIQLVNNEIIQYIKLFNNYKEVQEQYFNNNVVNFKQNFNEEYFSLVKIYKSEIFYEYIESL